MTTITLKIDERSKSGKAFLALTKVFVMETKGVEVLKIPNATTVASMKKTAKYLGLTKTSSHADLIKKLEA